MAARLAGRAGRAAFLGIVWGKHIVRAWSRRPGLLRPLGDASWLPQVLPLGEGAGTGPGLWAGLGTFLKMLLWVGSSSHSAD